LSNLSCSLPNCGRASLRCADCGSTREFSQGRYSRQYRVTNSSRPACEATLGNFQRSNPRFERRTRDAELPGRVSIVCGARLKCSRAASLFSSRPPSWRLHQQPPKLRRRTRRAVSTADVRRRLAIPERSEPPRRSMGHRQVPAVR
jgi:hypothetical protein